MWERYIERVMDDIGLPKHLKGYDSIYYGIEYQLNNGYAPMMVTYKYIADKMYKTSGSVERNIRHIIRWLLTYGDYEKIYNYFGASLANNGAITNSQFIITLAVAAHRLKKAEVNNVNNSR